MKERQATTWNGLVMLLLLLGALGGSVVAVIFGARGGEPGQIVAGMVGAVTALFLLLGLRRAARSPGRHPPLSCA